MPRRTHARPLFTFLSVAGCALLLAGVTGAAPQTRPATRPAVPGGAERRAARAEVDADQFQRELLHGDPSAPPGAADKVKRLMGESARRLAARDPGEGTQYVQEQILDGIDRIIEELDKGKKQQPPPRKTPCKKCRPGEPCDRCEGHEPGTMTPAPSPTKVAGADERNPAGNTSGAERSASTKNVGLEVGSWGKISPRLKGAAMEGHSERVFSKYQSLVADYYRAVAAKAGD